MAIRKTVEDAFVVDGGRAEWLPKVRAALESSGFKKVAVAEQLFEVQGNYKKATTWGTILVTLESEGDAQTRIRAAATANVDNIYSAFRSPGRKIIDQFKSGLT